MEEFKRIAKDAIGKYKGEEICVSRYFVGSDNIHHYDMFEEAIDSIYDAYEHKEGLTMVKIDDMINEIRKVVCGVIKVKCVGNIDNGNFECEVYGYNMKNTNSYNGEGSIIRGKFSVKHGLLHGKFETSYENNGEMFDTMMYDNGKCEGEYIGYHSSFYSKILNKMYPTCVRVKTQYHNNLQEGKRKEEGKRGAARASILCGAQVHVRVAVLLAGEAADGATPPASARTAPATTVGSASGGAGRKDTGGSG